MKIAQVLEGLFWSYLCIMLDINNFYLENIFVMPQKKFYYLLFSFTCKVPWMFLCTSLQITFVTMFESLQLNLQCLFSFNFGEQDMVHITIKDPNAEQHQLGAGHLNILMKIRYVLDVFWDVRDHGVYLIW